jgi:D-glycero-D-manno-heptose 1,7-bisphosphate phosphatase
MNQRRYVLLDRDGTVIAEKDYLSSVDQVEILPGAVEGLSLLSVAGYGLIIITNQSGIARGKLTLETLAEIHSVIERRLADAGVHIDAFYYCPHLPEEGCDCRKPKPLMAEKAAAEFGFDLAQSFVIGDKLSDIELGRNCGARTILVRTGYGREYEAAGLKADYVAEDLLEAALYIRESQTR